MIISLKEKFQAIESFTSSYMLKEMDGSTYARNVADVLQSLTLNNVYGIHLGGVKVDIPNKSLSTLNAFNTCFGVRVFPFITNFPTVFRYDTKYETFGSSSIGRLTKAISDIENGVTREEIVQAYRGNLPWVVEIDPTLFENSTGMNPSKIAAMILMDFVNVVFSDIVPDMIFDAYTEVYLRPAIYEEEIAPLHALYIVPVVNACINKNWITIKDPKEVKFNNISTSSNFSTEGIEEISDHLTDAIATLIRVYGSEVFMTDREKYDRVKGDVEWAMKFSSNFFYEKNKLRDELIMRGMITNSPNIRILYIAILCWIGYSLRLPRDNQVIGDIRPSIFDDPNIMRTYKFAMDMNRASTLAMVQMNYKRHYVSHPIDEATESLKDSFKKGFKGFSSKSKEPKLPAMEEIDLIFVDVDRVTCHSDRVWVLDKIAKCEREIDEFVSYYKVKDPSVVNEYRSVIDRMRRRIETAREEVLDKRSFKKEYRVFVEVPTGYEG